MANGANVKMLLVQALGSPPPLISGFICQNMTFDGNKANNASGDCVTCFSCFQPLFRNVTIQFAAANGLVGDGTNTALATSLMNFFEGHINASATANIFLNTYAQDTIVRDTFCEAAGTVGWLVNGSGSKFLSSMSFNSVQTNVLLNAFSVRTQVDGCVCDASNTSWGMIISGSTGNIITNNLFFNEASGCVVLTNSGGTISTLNIVTNNVLYSPGGATYPTPIGIKIDSTNVWNMVANNSVDNVIATRYQISEAQNVVFDPYSQAVAGIAYNNQLGGASHENYQAVSGGSPVTMQSQNALLTFTGLADTAAGAAITVRWNATFLSVSSLVRASISGMSVGAGACWAIQSLTPAAGYVNLVLVNVGSATSGAAGSATVLFELIN